jgi:hypothetical protein
MQFAGHHHVTICTHDGAVHNSLALSLELTMGPEYSRSTTFRGRKTEAVTDFLKKSCRCRKYVTWIMMCFPSSQDGEEPQLLTLRLLMSFSIRVSLRDNYCLSLLVGYSRMSFGTNSDAQRFFILRVCACWFDESQQRGGGRETERRTDLIPKSGQH